MLSLEEKVLLVFLTKKYGLIISIVERSLESPTALPLQTAIGSGLDDKYLPNHLAPVMSPLLPLLMLKPK